MTETTFKAYKFRLFTNSTQETELEIMLETHRRLYNTCLEQKKTAFEEEKRKISCTEQTAWFTQQKSENKYYSKINHSSAQRTIRRLDKTYIAFFKRVKKGKVKPGYPRFKGKGQFHSIDFTYGDGIKVIPEKRKVKIQHIGKIKCKFHREIEGNIKNTTLLSEGGHWYIILRCELEKKIIPASKNPPVGVDVGLENFLTTSDGEIVENPKYLKKSLPKIRKAQRAFDKKKKGGSNKKKAKKKLQKLYTKVKNQRKDHHHKTALNLIRCYGLIAVENLNIVGMLKNHRLNRAIEDAAWGSFLTILQYKAESAGVAVLEVDARGTSQECSGCGTEVKKTLSVRKHNCPDCGLSLHRDENAARNILARALQVRVEPVDANEESPVVQEVF
ncbi:MAG: transposase [Kiritimatiellae bacterium]|jgi:putative transposase|nr:transposase [Kiritimatiellia bacterium]